MERPDPDRNLLLMYLADELPEQDRYALEQRLATDAGLRQDLQQLEDAQQVAFDALARLDELSPLPVSESAAVRRASREIRRRLVRSHEPGESLAIEPRQRSLWWIYPAAAAAVVLLGFAIWMPRQAHNRIVAPIVPPANYGSYGYGYAMARLYIDSWDMSSELEEPGDSRPAADDSLAMSDPRDYAPNDPLNQLLLNADANQ